MKGKKLAYFQMYRSKGNKRNGNDLLLEKIREFQNMDVYEIEY